MDNKQLTFKDFILDDFQIQAIHAIEKNNSVVVSAQTGTGKTLIADYIINKFSTTDKRVIYTAPIKALSNQKYKEFKQSYGENAVGLVTGDIVINSRAQFLVMTTEIYRNMLVTRDTSVENISYVIFDEIHYINDIERGTVWEESVIFSPENIRFLCLSATIPNAREFAHWIETIKHHPVEIVQNTKRAVPLTHKVFEAEAGLCGIHELVKHAENDDIPDYKHIKGKQKQRKLFPKPATHLDLIYTIEQRNLFPAIFFVFSRAACQKYALELIRSRNYVNKEKLSEIIGIYGKHIKDEARMLGSSQVIKQLIQRGVAIHHAGLLPQQKDLVEELFEKGLIAVLYATETFAVGINMPAKCVMFNTLYKYDGISFRYLNSKEYFQIAGRAGRRGIDKEGIAVAIIDRKRDNLEKIRRLTDKDVEPIKSQFNLSYNTVLNLLHRYREDEIEVVLKSSFDYYLRKKQNKNIRIMSSFHHRVQLLEQHGFITADKLLTQKGIFAMYIYANELLIADIFCSETYKQLTDTELVLIVASIMFEGRRGTTYKVPMHKRELDNLLQKLQKNNVPVKKLNVTHIKDLSKIITRWMEGASFTEIINYANMQEGDYIRLFRQVIDMLRQIRRASTDYDLITRVEQSIEKIYRDVIKVDF